MVSDCTYTVIGHYSDGLMLAFLQRGQPEEDHIPITLEEFDVLNKQNSVEKILDEPAFRKVKELFPEAQLEEIKWKT